MIVLDTATWIWLVSDPGKLTKAARSAVSDHPTAMVSAISAWEVGMLVAKNRIRLDRPVDRWVDDALRLDGIESAAVDHRIGVLATLLPGEAPTDPADRLVVATALNRGCVLVTPDRKLLEYPFCPTVW